MTEQRISLEECHALAMQCLMRHNVSEAQARAIADTVTAAERDGCKSHGLFRIPGYVNSVRSGKVTPGCILHAINGMTVSSLPLEQVIYLLQRTAHVERILTFRNSNFHYDDL